MREIVGKKPMDHILYSGRAEVATAVDKRIQELLAEYQTGIQVSTVAIQNVQPPEQVQAAFDDAVKAGQDRERQINEGNAYSNKVLPEAQGQVARMIQEAEGYRAKVIGDAQGNTSRFASVEAEFAKAPDITRQRMYLSTVQEILESTSKIMIDSQASNNMLYLPLDKIMSQAAGDRATFSGSVESTSSAAAGTTLPAKPTTPARTRTPDTSGSATKSLLVNPYSR